MKIFSSFLLICAAIVAGPSGAFAADSNVKVLMRDKLTAAHGLLDALAVEDYGKLEHFAGLLADLGKATTWSKADSPDFQYYSKSFQNAALYVKEQAKVRNLEGVTVGYVRLSLECVQCHKFVRGQPNKR